jgi:peptidylprolyl isomerase
MLLRAPTALIPLFCVGLALGGACTATQPEPEKKAAPAEPEKKAAPAEPEKKAPAAPAEAPLPVDPSPDMKFDAPFDAQPVAKSTTASGIAIEDFVVGEGAEAIKGGEVEVHYTGYLTNGTVFDSSVQRKRPFTFELGAGRVIKGWDEGVAGMKVGGKRKLVIPAKLGYGERRAGKIPPNSTLVFTIELLSFTPPLPPPQPLSVFDAKPLSTKKLEKGLVVMDYKLGDGAEAKAGDNVSVHYRGTLKDGTEFDSSLARPRPLVFPLGQGRVIKGWDLGIAGMKVGGLRKLIVPAELAYGERARGKIPANADLTFTVELMAVKPPAAPTPPPVDLTKADPTRAAGDAKAGDATSAKGATDATKAAPTKGAADATKGSATPTNGTAAPGNGSATPTNGTAAPGKGAATPTKGAEPKKAG